METDRMTSIITPACVLDEAQSITGVHIGKNHENVFVQTETDIFVYRMQDLPSNEPYAWLKNCGYEPNSGSPSNDQFLIVSFKNWSYREQLLFFDISNGIKPGDLMQHWCGYGIGH
jgi:hypothetical protein